MPGKPPPAGWASSGEPVTDRQHRVIALAAGIGVAVSLAGLVAVSLIADAGDGQDVNRTAVHPASAD